ncbi:Lipopolysaccharide export system ATP-binding protein LptB [subsurface metagenome]
MPLLEVRNLTKYFGGLAAVDDLSFDVREGEILGLIGPNGAGKTTVFNCISGVFSPTSGKVFFNDEDVTGLKPNKIAQRGISRTFQITYLFDAFPAIANVLAACHMRAKAGVWRTFFNTPRYRQQEAEIMQQAMDLLKLLGLAEIALENTGGLPHGHKRGLGVAVALATQPKLLMLDEPVTGMNPEEVRVQMDRLSKIRDELGVTLVVVEHNMRAVMGICDRIVALNFGKQIAEGRPEEIRENPDIIEAYLGSQEDYAT